MNYQEIAKEIRKGLMKMFYESQEGHIGSALSCVDILTVLYFKTLKIDPKNPQAENRDRFILSKGHAAPALYVTLAEQGFFDKKLLGKYCQNGQKIAAHPTRGCFPGVEASTGSLGHGLSMGVGLALAAKRDKKDHRVFILMSDGECDEGSVWEAALFASHHKLDNLVGIIDYNKLQAYGRTNEVLNLEPFSEKWQSFGWSVREIDGHSFSGIENAFDKIPLEEKKPSLFIAHTVKGKGISFMEDRLEWHYKHLTKEDYEKALKELL